MEIKAYYRNVFYITLFMVIMVIMVFMAGLWYDLGWYGLSTSAGILAVISFLGLAGNSDYNTAKQTSEPSKDSYTFDVTQDNETFQVTQKADSFVAALNLVKNSYPNAVTIELHSLA